MKEGAQVSVYRAILSTVVEYTLLFALLTEAVPSLNPARDLQ
jgi:hypothetical protein